jgi:hypothetical protein
MPRNSNSSDVSRRRFLAVAGSVAATSSFAIGKDSSVGQIVTTAVPVKYVVTIDVTKNPIRYSVNHPNDPLNMTVNDVDEIKWQVTSAGPNPQHYVAIRFIATTPFVDPTNTSKPLPEFEWTEKDDATGGAGGGNTVTPGTHEYCVAVFDGVQKRLYISDPKIIVGTGNDTARAEVMAARGELREVQEKIETIESVLRKASEKLQ